MRKVDVEDFDIKIGEEDAIGITEGVAVYHGIHVHFSIVRILDHKEVHFGDPGVLHGLGTSESDLEKEILDVYDRG